jgi:hypothetical protein
MREVEDLELEDDEDLDEDLNEEPEEREARLRGIYCQVRHCPNFAMFQVGHRCTVCTLGQATICGYCLHALMLRSQA